MFLIVMWCMITGDVTKVIRVQYRWYWHRSGWWRYSGLHRSSGGPSLDLSASSCTDRSHLHTHTQRGQHSHLFVCLFVVLFVYLHCEVRHRGQSLCRSWRSLESDSLRPQNDYRSLNEPYSPPETHRWDTQVRHTGETGGWSNYLINNTFIILILSDLRPH